MDYRAKIKTLREARGWSQAEFGDHIGESQQTISNIEKGRTEGLSKKKWELIAKTLGVSVAELLGDEAQKPSPDELAEIESLREIFREDWKDPAFRASILEWTRGFQEAPNDVRRAMLVLLRAVVGSSPKAKRRGK